MSPGDRFFLIKRAVLRALADCNGFSVLESALRESVAIKVDFLRPTTAEIDSALYAVDTNRLCVGLQTERGRKFKITAEGELWLAENP